MTLVEHLHELRNRLFISMVALVLGSVVCFIFYSRIFDLFYEPFARLEKTFGSTLFINTIFEGFVVRLKLSIVAGVVLSFPVHLYNLVRFIFPGLTRQGKEDCGNMPDCKLFPRGTRLLLLLFLSHSCNCAVSYRRRFCPEECGDAAELWEKHLLHSAVPAPHPGHFPAPRGDGDPHDSQHPEKEDPPEG